MAAISAYDKINYSQLKLPSFEELAMAPAHLTKKHEEAEENLAAITSEATKAERLAMESPDSEASKMYQGYLQKLQEATDALGQKGVNMSGVKQRVNEARGTYNSTIAPILSAGELRSKYAEAAASAKTSGMEVAPIENSIDAWMGRNGQMPAINGVSHDKIYKQASDIGESLKSQIDQVAPQLQQVMGPNGKPIRDEYIYYVTTGAVPDNIMKMMRRELTPEQMSKIDQTINNSVEGLLEANNVYGLFKPGSEEAERLRTTAFLGMNSAVGGTQMGKITDEATRAERNVSLEIDIYKRKKKIDAEIERNAASSDLGNNYPSVDTVITNPDIKLAEEAEKLFSPSAKDVLTKILIAPTGLSFLTSSKEKKTLAFLDKIGINYKGRPSQEVVADIQDWVRYNSVSSTSYSLGISDDDKIKTIEALGESGALTDANGDPVSLTDNAVKDLVVYDKENMTVKGTNADIKVSPLNQKVYIGNDKKAIFVNLDKIDDKNLKRALIEPNIEISRRTGIPFEQVSPATIASHKYRTVREKLDTPEVKELIQQEANQRLLEISKKNPNLTDSQKNEVYLVVKNQVKEMAENQYDEELYNQPNDKEVTVGGATRGSIDKLFVGLTYKNKTK